MVTGLCGGHTLGVLCKEVQCYMWHINCASYIIQGNRFSFSQR